MIKIVIQTTEGRKDLEDIKVDVHKILRFALNDNQGISSKKSSTIGRWSLNPPWYFIPL